MITVPFNYVVPNVATRLGGTCAHACHVQVARRLAPDGAAAKVPSSVPYDPDAAVRRRDVLRDIITVLCAHEQLGFRPREHLLAGVPCLQQQYPAGWRLTTSLIRQGEQGPELSAHRGHSMLDAILLYVRDFAILPCMLSAYHSYSIQAIYRSWILFEPARLPLKAIF